MPGCAIFKLSHLSNNTDFSYFRHCEKLSIEITSLSPPRLVETVDI
jgi:hypothetical protein